MSLRTVTGTNSYSVFDARYEILATIGRGQNSVVYKSRALGSTASDATPRDLVALKVLTGNSKNPQQNLLRMKREAIALLSCRHENVIRLNDFVVCKTGSDICYLSMEYADCGDLLAVLDRTEQLSVELVLQLTHQLLSGLEAVHRAGIIHRDIKPDNLLLTSEGVLKIADFGVAVLPTEEFQSGQAGIGTFDYLSPENLEAGIISEQSDLYAVGVTVFQLLTKQLPFFGQTLTAQLSSKMSGERRPLRNFRGDVPTAVEALLNTALAITPEERFQNSIEFRDAVEAILRESYDFNPDDVEAERSAIRGAAPIPFLNPTGSDHTFAMENDRLTVKKSIIARARNEVKTKRRVQALARSLEQAPMQAQAGTISLSEEVLQQHSEHSPSATMDEAPPELTPKSTKGGMPPLGRLTVFLVSFALVAFAVSDLRLAESAGAIAAVSQSGLVNIDKSYLPEENRLGVMYGLLSDNQPTVFSIVRSADRSALSISTREANGKAEAQILITLGIPGSLPAHVSAPSLLKGSPVTVTANGLKITLWLDKNENDSLQGRFRDEDSGRTGRWATL